MQDGNEEWRCTWNWERIFFCCGLGLTSGLSRDIGNLDKTSPGPTRGIIVGLEIHEACEMEPLFGGWYLSFVASNRM